VVTVAAVIAVTAAAPRASHAQKAASGTLVVLAPRGSAVAGAAIEVDGELVGEAPGELEVDVGPHQVVLLVDGDLVFEEWIQMEPGGRVVIEPTIEGLPDEEDLSTESADESAGAGADDAANGSFADVAPGAGDANRRLAGTVDTARLGLFAGLELSGRSFEYAGVTTGNLRPYDVFGVSFVRLGAEAFPLRRGPLRHVGVAASYGRAFGLDSEVCEAGGDPPDCEDGAPPASVDTRWTELDLGVRGRFAIADGVLLGAGLSYGAVAFEFGTAGAATEQAPGVDYRFVRVASSARYASGLYAVFGGAALLHLLAADGVAERFSEVGMSGVELGAGVARRVDRRFEIRFGANYRRFNYAITSQPTDLYRATGAVDQLFGVTLGVAFVH
jgi:hypothetical protein